MTAQRDCVPVLRGAVPGRDVHSGDTPPYPLLSVQHHLSMPVAQRAQCDRLLAARRLRREGDAGHHRSAGVLGLYVADRREHTGHIRVRPTHRLVIIIIIIIFYSPTQHKTNKDNNMNTKICRKANSH